MADEAEDIPPREAQPPSPHLVLVAYPPHSEPRTRSLSAVNTGRSAGSTARCWVVAWQCSCSTRSPGLMFAEEGTCLWWKWQRSGIGFFACVFSCIPGEVGSRCADFLRKGGSSQVFCKLFCALACRSSLFRSRFHQVQVWSSRLALSNSWQFHIGSFNQTFTRILTSFLMTLCDPPPSFWFKVVVFRFACEQEHETLPCHAISFPVLLSASPTWPRGKDDSHHGYIPNGLSGGPFLSPTMFVPPLCHLRFCLSAGLALP